IEEWWKATHEAAHAAFRLTKVDEILPPSWHAHLDKSSRDEMSSLQMLGEQFANWFDWRYIFKRDTAFYLQTIWRAWIGLPVVWQSKPQYFARSFAVLIAEDTDLIAAISKESKHQTAIPFIQKRWDKFQELVRDVPDMREFMEQAKPDLERT